MATERDSRCWWSPDVTDVERNRRFMSTCSHIYKEQNSAREQMMVAARLYGVQNLGGLGPTSYRTNRPFVQRAPPLSLNVIKAVASTYTAMLTEDRPKVSFVTSGADWDEQMKAEDLETFVEGTFTQCDVYELADQLALDSALFPAAWVKAYGDKKEKKICIERVLPWSVGIDNEQAMYGDPPEIYQWQAVDRAWLQGKYPKLASKIETADSTWMDPSVSKRDSMRKATVWVVEGWHKGDDGWHMLCVGDVVLESEKYTRKRFPLEPLWREKPIVGMHGITLVDELKGIQREINIILMRIQKSLRTGGCHWLVPNGCEIDTTTIDDVIGGVIRYRGQAPDLKAFESVAPEDFQQLDRLYGKAFELIGVPQTFAEGQKPADLSSGKALRTYADIASKRFEPAYRNYQSLFLRLARQVLDLAREMPTLKVKAPSKDFFRTIRAGEVMLDEDAYTLQMYPTNALADDPAERMAQVQDLANSGWINPQAAMRLMNFPDLQAFSDTANASYNLVQDQASRMLREGKYYPPSRFMDTTEAQVTMVALFLNAQRKRAPQDRLNLMLRWLRQLASNAKLDQPPPPPVTQQTLAPANQQVLPNPPAAPAQAA